jgi:hypothetical protein
MTEEVPSQDFGGNARGETLFQLGSQRRIAQGHVPPCHSMRSSLLTRRWRKTDSNSWSHLRARVSLGRMGTEINFTPQPPKPWPNATAVASSEFNLTSLSTARTLADTQFVGDAYVDRLQRSC